MEPTYKHMHIFGRLAEGGINMALSASLDQTEVPQNRRGVQLLTPYVSRICLEDITADFLARSISFL